MKKNIILIIGLVLSIIAIGSGVLLLNAGCDCLSSSHPGGMYEFICNKRSSWKTESTMLIILGSLGAIVSISFLIISLRKNKSKKSSQPQTQPDHSLSNNT